MKLTPMRLALALVFLVPATDAQAQQGAGQPVDLALVLAVDASGSVNQPRFELQKHGYAEAFRSRDVIDAIASGARHAIAVAMVQWTGPTLHVQVIDWTRIFDAASARGLADAIDATGRRLYGGGTSLSGAIDTGAAMLAADPFPAPRRVIDISGDGSNNAGRPAEMARDEVVKAGIVINGLPISWIEPGLDAYYRSFVIGGPGAFIVSIDSYDNFAEAIRRKLVTEIAAGPAPSLASNSAR
jgi:hypothetical protein